MSLSWCDCENFTYSVGKDYKTGGCLLTGVGKIEHVHFRGVLGMLLDTKTTLHLPGGPQPDSCYWFTTPSQAKDLLYSHWLSKTLPLFLPCGFSFNRRFQFCLMREKEKHPKRALEEEQAFALRSPDWQTSHKPQSYSASYQDNNGVKCSWSWRRVVCTRTLGQSWETEK